jgi:predicted CXXCH cytochrome family protein
MKKVLALVAAAGIIAAATTSFGASIVKSKHDLSGTASHGNATYAGTSTQICVYCHAPHNAASNLPLWNRSNPAGSAFTLYSGVNMTNVSFKGGFTADSTSLFCMSCHDGQTAMSAIHNAGAIDGTGSVSNGIGLGGYHTATAGVFGTANIGASTANLTRNLQKTHPINFPVSASLNTGNDLNLGSGATMGPIQPALVSAGYGYTTGPSFPLYKTTSTDGRRDTANRSLECGSCHAVHDSGFSPFLRDTMAGSQLCLGCHNK